MRLTVAILIALALLGCSNKPRLHQILDQALGYTLERPYSIVSHKRSPKFLDALSKYNESYQLEISDLNYKKLLTVANSHWKLQPKSSNGVIAWERISLIDNFSVTTVSSFQTGSKFVNIHISE